MHNLQILRNRIEIIFKKLQTYSTLDLTNSYEFIFYLYIWIQTTLCEAHSTTQGIKMGGHKNVLAI